MCGRFTLTADLPLLAERFHFDPAELSYTPSYNIAPSQQILTVRHDGRHNRATYLRWGLVPSWAKEPGIGHRMINARVETLAEFGLLSCRITVDRCGHCLFQARL